MTKTLAEEIEFGDGSSLFKPLMTIEGQVVGEIGNITFDVAAIQAVVHELDALKNAIIILPDDAVAQVGDIVQFCGLGRTIGVSHSMKRMSKQCLIPGDYKIIQRQGKPVIYESQLKPKQGE